MEDYFRIRLELRGWEMASSEGSISVGERKELSGLTVMDRSNGFIGCGVLLEGEDKWIGRHAEILNAPAWTYDRIFKEPPAGWKAVDNDVDGLEYHHTSGALVVLTRGKGGVVASQHGSCAQRGAELVETSKALLEMSYLLAEADALAKPKRGASAPPKGWVFREGDESRLQNVHAPEIVVDLRLVTMNEVLELADSFISLGGWRRRAEELAAAERERS
jgi:hypothetical protein